MSTLALGASSIGATPITLTTNLEDNMSKEWINTKTGSIKVDISEDSLDNYIGREYIDNYGIGGSPTCIVRIGNLYIQITHEMEDKIREYYQDI